MPIVLHSQIASCDCNSDLGIHLSTDISGFLQDFKVQTRSLKQLWKKKSQVHAKVPLFFSPLVYKSSFQKVKICTIYSLSDNVKH